MTVVIPDVTVGVLALQGAFSEHVQLLRAAAESLALKGGPAQANVQWSLIEVRTPAELARCDGLIVPGGESTTMSLVAARSGLLEPLRHFVKVLEPSTNGVRTSSTILTFAARQLVRHHPTLCS